jgi:hypothetical protein
MGRKSEKARKGMRKGGENEKMGEGENIKWVTNLI